MARPQEGRDYRQLLLGGIPCVESLFYRDQVKMYAAPFTRLNLMWPSWPGSARVTGEVAEAAAAVVGGVPKCALRCFKVLISSLLG